LNALRYTFLVLSVVFFSATHGSARHIIGGDFSYECLGNNTYRITLNIYRDCYALMAAPLDDPAFITTFRGGGIPAQYGDFRRVFLTQRGVTPAETGSPCVLPPPDVCVEYGQYVFDVILPYFADGYHIVYQRCCRNNTISNILNPGDVGATYTTFISGEAQQSCNNSPTFNDFPPVVVCADDALNFDHSATDTEGDSLVYELCAPTIGGDRYNNTPEVASTPNSEYPHYPVVTYRSSYSKDMPLGGDPPLNIDAETGLITGTPIVLGQFVVGVCVSEYRDGRLLSTTRRDFQFNVTDCERSIIADIEEDELVGQRSYIINSCGDNTVTFTNESRLVNFIDGYYWEFDIGNGIESSTETNPTVTFDGVGSYEGFLIVNPGNSDMDCTDTATIFVNIYPEILSEFIFSETNCDNSPVQFTDQSYTGSGTFTDWQWNFGDGTAISNEQNPSHLFAQAGSFEVKLTVTDINNCRDTYVQTVDWFPTSQIDVSIGDELNCIPSTLEFMNNSFPINGYDIEWDLGDGTSSNEANPVHTYTESGVYTVGITITSPTGCVASETFPDFLEVLESPIAAFSYMPEVITNFSPDVDFTDESIDAVDWFWDFDTGDNSILQNPYYSYLDTGKYEVQLLVTHESGCQDSISQVLDVMPRYTYYLPNAFTPNYDDVNDGFRGAGLFYGLEAFEMTVWNRWGEMIFQTKDPDTAWNGRKNNNGQMLPLGVYVYHVKLTGNRGMKEELTGYVTLVR